MFKGRIETEKEEEGREENYSRAYHEDNRRAETASASARPRRSLFHASSLAICECEAALYAVLMTFASSYLLFDFRSSAAARKRIFAKFVKVVYPASKTYFEKCFVTGLHLLLFIKAIFRFLMPKKPLYGNVCCNVNFSLLTIHKFPSRCLFFFVLLLFSSPGYLYSFFYKH